MAVSPGYKQTEVGVIPEDWDVRQFGEFAASRRDRVDPRKSGAHEFCVELEHIGQASGRLIGNTSTGTEASLKTVFQADDVLFGKLRAYLRKYWLAERGGVCSTEIWALHTNPRLATPSFVYQVVMSNLFIEAASYSYGTHMPRSDWNLVRSCEFPLPPLPEQRAIAAALSDVDALLAKLDQLIAKKRDLKQAAMQQLLTGQTRLPGFGGEWEIRPLGSVIDGLEAGVSVNSSDDCQASDAPCILKTSAVVNGRFLPDECKVIMQNDIWRARLNPRRNTILVSRMNTPDLVGEVGYVEKDYPNLFIPDRLWMTRFRSEDEVSVQWMTYVLNSAEYKKQLKTVATGTSGSMKNISKNGLLSLHIPFPEIQEQTAIATVLSDMDAELAALEARRDKTRALKQGMMQELLTGRIRLV